MAYGSFTAIAHSRIPARCVRSARRLATAAVPATAERVTETPPDGDVPYRPAGLERDAVVVSAPHAVSRSPAACPAILAMMTEQQQLEADHRAARPAVSAGRCGRRALARCRAGQTGWPASVERDAILACADAQAGQHLVSRRGWLHRARSASRPRGDQRRYGRRVVACDSNPQVCYDNGRWQVRLKLL